MIFLQLPTTGSTNTTLIYNNHNTTLSYDLCFRSTHRGVISIAHGYPWSKRKLFTVKQIKYPK